LTAELDLTLTKKQETLTDLYTQGSGNSIDTLVFHPPYPQPSLMPERKIEDISDVASEKGALGLIYSDDIEKALEKAETLFEEIKELGLHERNLRSLSRVPSVTINASVLIDQDTAMLDVFSDGIGPALLFVLREYGSMSIKQMLKCSGIERDVLISRLETLQRNGLIKRRKHRYSISDEGIILLSHLALLEERTE
jgi:DNA-binding HxlR family transcriptional regulator